MKGLLLFVLLACLMPPAGQAQRPSDSAAGSKIVALESLSNQAVQAKDANALDEILDDTFVEVRSDGSQRTKAEVLADVKASSTKFIVRSEGMVVHLHGDTAIITGIRTTTGLDHRRPFTRRDRFVDTWFHKNGSWVSIASLATPTA